ncbi:MAG TPA: hypothetical protein PLK99_07340 [Burkholderiales bacterium]|nr:hypothetical protein [Burkholderiales bacterium]
MEEINIIPSLDNSLNRRKTVRDPSGKKKKEEEGQKPEKHPDPEHRIDTTA